jgi:hypothetical protein
MASRYGDVALTEAELASLKKALTDALQTAPTPNPAPPTT